MDPNVVTLLFSSDVVKQVFNEVLKRRRIQLKDLRESLAKVPEFEPALTIPLDFHQTPDEVSASIRERAASPLVQERIEDVVEKLKNAKLIDERPAPIKDFSTYYVTANGLNAERELRAAATM